MKKRAIANQRLRVSISNVFYGQGTVTVTDVELPFAA